MENKIYDYKLLPKLSVYFNKTKSTVYLADSSKKKYYIPIENHINNNDFGIYKKIIVDNQNFNIKIQKNIFYIKHPNFLEPDKYYILGNSITEDDNLIDLIQYNKIEDGEIKNSFEIGINIFYPTSIIVFTKDYEIYDSIYSNLFRQLKMESSKRTKNWKIGYKYYSVDKNYYYLGKFYSRIDILGNFVNDDDIKNNKVHLYTTEITSDEKSISDVLKKRFIIYSEDKTNNYIILSCNEHIINVKNNLGSLYEGEKIFDLEDIDLDNYKDEVISNLYNQYMFYRDSSSDNSNIFSYESLDRDFLIKLFNTLIISPKEKSSISEDSKKKIKEIIKRYIIYSLTLKDKKQLDKFKKQSISNIIEDLILNLSGYSLETSVKLFNFYGIDIKNLIEKIYSDYLFLEDNLMNNLYDFQDYVKYVSFFRKFDNHLNFSYFNKKLSNSKTLKDTLNSEDLSNFLKEIFYKCIDFGGDSRYCYKFNYFNSGTIKNPVYLYNIGINLVNIINYCNGIENIPDKIKKEIMDKKYYLFFITVEDGIEF